MQVQIHDVESIRASVGDYRPGAPPHFVSLELRADGDGESPILTFYLPGAGDEAATIIDNLIVELQRARRGLLVADEKAEPPVQPEPGQDLAWEG